MIKNVVLLIIVSIFPIFAFGEIRYTETFINTLHRLAGQQLPSATFSDFQGNRAPCATRLLECITLANIERSNQLYDRVSVFVAGNHDGKSFDSLNLGLQEETIVQTLLSDSDSIRKAMKIAIDKIKALTGLELNAKLKELEQNQLNLYFQAKKEFEINRDNGASLFEHYVLAPVGDFSKNEKEAINLAAHARTWLKNMLWSYYEAFKSLPYYRTFEQSQARINKKVMELGLEKLEQDPHLNHFHEDEVLNILLEMGGDAKPPSANPTHSDSRHEQLDDFAMRFDNPASDKLKPGEFKEFIKEGSGCQFKIIDCIALAYVKQKEGLFNFANKLSSDLFKTSYFDLGDNEKKLLLAK